MPSPNGPKPPEHPEGLRIPVKFTPAAHQGQDSPEGQEDAGPVAEDLPLVLLPKGGSCQAGPLRPEPEEPMQRGQLPARVVGAGRTRAKENQEDAKDAIHGLLESDAGIDEGHTEVGQDVAEEHEGRGDRQDPQHHPLVLLEDGIELEEAKPVDVENLLDQEAPADQERDVLPDGSGDRDDGIAEGVPEHGTAIGDPLGGGRSHVIRREVVHQVVLHHQRHEGKAPDEVAGQRHGGMVQEIQDLPARGKVRKVLGDEARAGKTPRKTRFVCATGPRIVRT